MVQSISLNYAMFETLLYQSTHLYSQNYIGSDIRRQHEYTTPLFVLLLILW